MKSSVFRAIAALATTLLIGACGGGDSSSSASSTASPSPAPASAPAPIPVGAAVTTFDLTSAVGGVQPFTVGLGFKKGDVETAPTLNISDQQVIVLRRWNDGSVKHAVASGQVALTPSTPKTIIVQNGPADAGGGPALTATNIQNANPQASIQFGAVGTVSLSSLLATPFRTPITGPEMTEAHYRASVGSDPTLVAWFHVRLYKNGKVWVRAIGENGYLDLPTANKSYVPVVTIGGVIVWNNGGGTLAHYAHTRWAQEGWVGGDPQTTPKHDTTYLKNTRLVPNYMVRTPSAAVLNGLYQSYAPNQNGNWTRTMGDPGFQNQIGVLPLWDALYVTSGADARAYRSVLANSKALASYPIVWNDSVTKRSVKPSDRPTWTTDGPNQGGSTEVGAGNGLVWEVAHHGSGGYLCYLITADYYCLETLEQQAGLAYLVASSVNFATNPPSNNYGTSRRFNGQTRGYAWSLRTLSQYAGIAPADDVLAADYQALLANNMTHLKTMKDGVSPAGIGYIYEYDVNLYDIGLVAPWQQHFFIQSLGMGSDLEPLADMTNYKQVRDYMYRAAVGILGDSSGYCFTRASEYRAKSNDGTSNAPNAWYKTWSQVYTATFAVPTACGNTLAGGSAGEPSEASSGYWGNLLPAIVYAVDHSAPGAAASWSRLTGATNWSAVLDSGFDDIPIFGVMPRQ